MTNRKRYTREFKLEAARLLETSDKPITDIARQLGIRCSLLSAGSEADKYVTILTLNGGDSVQVHVTAVP